jgi:hypothetical protein
VETLNSPVVTTALVAIIGLVVVYAGVRLAPAIFTRKQGYPGEEAIEAALRPIRDGAPTIAYTRHGAREITWRGDIDFATPVVTYYDYMRAATEMSVRLDFVSDDEYESGHNYELHITLPRMVWPEDGAHLPAIDGSLTPKKQAIRLVSMMHTSVNTDLGVSIKTTDDLT